MQLHVLVASTEKRKKVRRKKLSHRKLQGVDEPSSSVSTKRGVMHEATQVIHGSSLQSLSEKGSLQDCSVTTSREVPHESTQATSDKHGQGPPVVASHEVTLESSKATANNEFWESVERNINQSHDTSVVTCSAVPDVLSQEVISEVVPGYSDTAISKTANPDKITISKVADKDIVTNLCVGTQKRDDLKPCAGGVSNKNKTLSDFTSDKVNVAKRLTAGEHYVNEFRKKNILKSVNVTHTHSKESDVISCCQEQQVTVPSEVIGTEIRRIRKMQQISQNQISQKMNSLLKTCKQCTLPCVKCHCSKCIAHAENHQCYSEYPLGYGSPELYESKSSLSKSSAFSRHEIRSSGRNQPCTKIPSHVAEMAHFQPTQSETFFNDSSDQYVGDCMKPSEDELFEDVLHSATHQSQKQPSETRRILKTSQLHPPSYSAKLKKLAQQQKLTQWDVGLPGCSHTQTECLTGDILQDCCRSHMMSHPKTCCSYTKDTSRKRNHSRSFSGANTRHGSNPKKNSVELSKNEVAVTDDCLHAGKSSPQHIRNISSDSTSEEGMLKAEILLGCLIKEIKNNVRQSSQNVDTRQRYSETEQYKHDLSSLQESSCKDADFSRHYDYGSNQRSWKIRDSGSYLAHRKHVVKSKALDYLVGATNDDARWSPWKVDKKHAKPRKTKRAMLKSPDDEDMRYQPGNSPLIRKRSARAHSKSKYSRKAEALLNDPVEDTTQDVSRTPSKKHKKKHSRKKSKHGSKHRSKHGSSGTLKSTDDTSVTTNDHFDHPDSYPLPSRDGKMSDSAQKEHLRKAEALLDFPTQASCHDIRWRPERETKKHKHNKAREIND